MIRRQAYGGSTGLTTAFPMEKSSHQLQGSLTATSVCLRARIPSMESPSLCDSRGRYIQRVQRWSQIGNRHSRQTKARLGKPIGKTSSFTTTTAIQIKLAGGLKSASSMR